MSRKNRDGVIVLSALELDILRVLISEEIILYGLELLEKINQACNKVGLNKLGIGSLYPSLKRMKKVKLVAIGFHEAEAEAKYFRRKYYKLFACCERRFLNLLSFSKFRIFMLRRILGASPVAM